MQISPTAPAQQGSTVLSYARYEELQQSFQSSSSLEIDFSESGDTVTITGYQQSVYRESLYTATEHTVTQSTASSANSGVSTLENESTALASEIVSDYLETIRDRVNQLIRDAAELSDRYQRYILGLDSAGDTADTIPETRSIQLSSEQYSLYEVRSESITSVTLDTASFSAENTAARIVQFALAHYDGGDKAAYVEDVRAAIMEGFQEAEAAFGGMLPDVSYQTIDLVNEALDRFARGESVDIMA